MNQIIFQKNSKTFHQKVMVNINPMMPPLRLIGLIGFQTLRTMQYPNQDSWYPMDPFGENER